MTVKVYDPAAVTQILGTIPISGYADGTFISVEWNEDAFNLTVGVDKEACRAKTNNVSATITCTLLQSSITNDLLCALHQVDLNTPNGDGVVPYLLKDLTGRTLLTAETAWIRKMASVSFSKEAESREWVIETDALIGLVGGN